MFTSLCKCCLYIINTNFMFLFKSHILVKYDNNAVYGIIVTQIFLNNNYINCADQKSKMATYVGLRLRTI